MAPPSRGLPILATDALTWPILGISIGTGRGRIPWAQIQRAQYNFIEPKYLPKGVTLTQYHHLRQQDVDALLKHWALRQTAGDVPLKFRKVVKCAQTDKPASEEESDSDADMGRSEEAEEDLQGDDGSQVGRGGAPQVNSSRNGSTEPAHPGQSPGNAAQNPSEVGWLL